MATKRENQLSYQWVFAGAALCLLVYLLKDILTPFFIAGILAYICSPLVDRLEQRKLNRTIATLLVLVLLAALCALVLLVVLPLMQKDILMLIQRLPAYLGALRESVEPRLQEHFGVALAIDPAQLQAMLAEHWKTIGNLAGQALQILGNHSLALFGWLTTLLLVPLVLFYLLRDWHALLARISVLIPRRWCGRAAIIGSEIDQVLAEFLRGQLTVMLLMSVFYATGLWLAGLDMALPIGLVAGLLGFVPYLGIATGIVLALFTAALQFGTLGALIPIAVVFVLGQLLESMVLTPQLVGERIGLHPVAVIFALLAGGQLFGFSGVLLALPAGAAIAVGTRHVTRYYLASDTYLK